MYIFAHFGDLNLTLSRSHSKQDFSNQLKMDKNIVCVLLLGVIFLSFNVFQETEAVKTDYIGCYAGVPLQEVYHNERSNINWTVWEDSFKKIVQNCSKEAVAKGYDIFAVHFWGECRKDNDPNRYKSSKSGKCYGRKDGMVGSSKSSAVYKIDKSCGGGHKHGDKWYVSKSHHGCQFCECKNNAKKCEAYWCLYEFDCEKYTPARSDRCCRKCACYHNGQDKMNGEKWDDRRTTGTCNQCRCINGQAKCYPVSCRSNCPNPEYIPGECCPRCPPKAPVVPTGVLITTRPLPVFPSWVLGKRSHK